MIYWLTIESLIAFHDEQLAEHGGLSGIRDEGLLVSALTRPRQKESYGENDICVLAASLAFGLAKNHLFLDGNKRTALVAAVAFLGVNGLYLETSNDDAYETIANLAAGKVSEEELAEWFKKYSREI